MARGGIAELQLGFWIGLGISLALAAWSIVQLLIGKAVHRDG